MLWQNLWKRRLQYFGSFNFASLRFVLFSYDWQSRRDTERQRSDLWLVGPLSDTCNSWAGVLSSVCLHGWMRLRCFSYHLLPPSVHVNRNLNQKWSSQSSTQELGYDLLVLQEATLTIMSKIIPPTQLPKLSVLCMELWICCFAVNMGASHEKLL